MAKINKQNKKMIGVLLPEDLYNRFVLIMLAENTSKTKLGESIIESFLKNNRKQLTEENLIKKVQENVRKEWKACKSKRGNLVDFKINCRFSLMAEGLPIGQIDLILDFEDNEN